MGERTGIAWCTSSWSPWIGCTEVSPGCDACYARVLDARYRYGGAAHWGPGVPRHRTSKSTWKRPLTWDNKAFVSGERWTVFPSLCDPFDNEVPEVWRHDFWKLIQATPNLTWLLLTKRIGNAVKMIGEARPHDDGRGAWPWSNVWIGASVVNQEEADRDIPKLLATPAAKRFVSYEPALGPVTWPGFNAGTSWCPICKAIVPDSVTSMHEVTHGVSIGDAYDPKKHTSSVYDLLHWVIVGGESNQGKHKARPFDLAWARSTIEQCGAAGVPAFVKQFGSAPYDSSATHIPVDTLFIKDRAGADPSEWPEDLRVQEFPT